MIGVCSMEEPLPRRREISGDLDSLAGSSPNSATAADRRHRQGMSAVAPADVNLELDLGRNSWDEEQDILQYVQHKV